MMMHHLVLLVLTVTLSAAGTVKQFYRCCDHGEHYSFETGMCAPLPKSVSKTDTEIPVYKGNQFQQRLSADSFSIITAPNWCNSDKNDTTRFHLDEEFYLQQDGRIFIPHDTKPYMDRNAFCITYDTGNKEYMVFGCDQAIQQEQRYNTLGLFCPYYPKLCGYVLNWGVPGIEWKKNQIIINYTVIYNLLNGCDFDCIIFIAKNVPASVILILKIFLVFSTVFNIA